MKWFLIAFFTTVLLYPLVCQEEKYIDVPGLLQNLAQATSDTARIMIKCRLAEAYRSNKPDSLEILAHEALTESLNIGFKKGEIHALIALCVLSREKGDLPQALELGLDALKKAEEEKLPYEQIYCLVRVAVVYIAVKDIPKGVVYLQKAESILKNHYNNFQWAVVQLFLGDAYIQMNDLDAAERQLKIIDEEQLSNPSWKILSNRMRANISAKQNDLPLAVKYYKESNEAAMEQGEFREAATTNNALALTYKKMGQTDSAIFYAKQGLLLGQMLSFRNRILAASNLLAELYTDKDPKEAVKYFQLASAANDSMYGVQKVLQLQSSTIKEQERQAELEAARIAYKNKVRQGALLGGIGTVVIIAFILFRNNKQKQKANTILETTLSHLKNTQAQLIQSEKMASLGELTAGIAHEIQNPLNFVNNFSEVNVELIKELEEAASSESRDASMEADILSNIKENSEKINHHGKRADAIVKSMLQHSKGSDGSNKKEPTDINALADEYFRLAYHGIKAKDKSFNSKMESDFDSSIGNIHVVPQEIGRVLLNLINNAFYAVNEKSKQIGENYEPTVSVSTKKVDNKVLISVQDNGNGIPQKVLDKIFQPFFTTKPTGQGTGLGLSMSYDIVKAHGGSISVVSNFSEPGTIKVNSYNGPPGGSISVISNYHEPGTIDVKSFNQPTGSSINGISNYQEPDALNVETASAKEIEGSKFTIILPVN